MVVEVDTERGLVMRILLHSPKDLLAGALAVAAIGAIVANALFLQSGPHPSPMFGSVVTLPAPGVPQANPLPRARPMDTTNAAPSIDSRPAAPKAVDPRAADPKTPDQKSSDTRTADPLANLVKSTTAAPAATSSIARPPV